MQPIVVDGMGRRLAGGVGFTFAFVLAQLVAGAVVIGGAGQMFSGARVDAMIDDLGSRDGVAFLLVVECFMAVFGIALVLAAPGLRAVGLRAPVAAQWRGMRLLAPVLLILVGPGIAIALSEGRPLVNSSLTIVHASMFILLAMAIGITEELFFRGLVLWRLGGAAAPGYSIVVSSLLFGIPHAITTGAPDEAQLLNAAAVTLSVGVPFAVVRLATGALMPLIVAHAAIDIWAFLQLGSVTPTGDPSISSAIVVLMIGALVAAGYWAWYVRRAPAVSLPAQTIP